MFPWFATSYWHDVVIGIDGIGPIPKELGQLTYLHELDLQWNELDGEKKTRETPIGLTSHFPSETIVRFLHRMLEHKQVHCFTTEICSKCGVCSWSVQVSSPKALLVLMSHVSVKPSPVVNKYCT